MFRLFKKKERMTSKIRVSFVVEYNKKIPISMLLSLWEKNSDDLLQEFKAIWHKGAGNIDPRITVDSGIHYDIQMFLHSEGEDT